MRIRGKVVTINGVTYIFKREALTARTKALRAALLVVGKEIKIRAKSKTPTETGALRSSLIVKKNFKGNRSNSVIIGAKVGERERKGKLRVPQLYARKIEEAKGYLRNSISKKDAEKVTRMMEAELGK